MRYSRLAATVLAAFAGVVPAARAETPLREAVAADYDARLGALFLDFHRHPELSFLETRTAARVAEELREAGAVVTEGVGGTGVVGVMANGDGPRILVRADMDGLPVEERSGLDYASTARQVDRDGVEKSVMHACGHDVHMTSLVGTARRLAALRDRWAGTVVLVAQPAEERIGGAKAMLADGLYERFGVPDVAIAFHVTAEGPAGKVAMQGGIVASSSDSVDVVVRGVGAHGASPHEGKDPIYLASQFVVALQGLVSREIAPLEPGVVTVGSFHAGNKHNIIPEEARLQLTVRADSDETREALLSGIERIAAGLGRAAGLPEDRLPIVTRTIESTPPTVNDPAIAARLHAAMLREIGADGLFDWKRQGMGAEDFPYFLRTEHKVPGVYFRVGGTPQADLDAAKAGGRQVPSHHSPQFRIDPRPSVTAGIEATTVAVLELLARP